MHITLYSTQGCHLCEEAEQLLQQTTGHAITLEKVDIAELPLLVDHYGTRIPVLQDAASGHELGWPFDLPQIREFLTAHCVTDPT